MYNNQYMIDNLSRQKERIDDMIKNYQTIPQQPNPINNFINTNQNNMQDNLYEMKKLNENDEVENIAIFKDTIFIGEDRMQIKKLDGTIEKYQIKKVYPRDKKDDKIDELNKKIEELEMRLNEHRFNENNANTKSIETSPKQRENDKFNDKPTTTRTSESVSKSK